MSRFRCSSVSEGCVKMFDFIYTLAQLDIADMHLYYDPDIYDAAQSSVRRYREWFLKEFE